jgi:surfactin synthase thioesterase subunit
MNPNRWIVSRPGPERRARLYCFSYAGGNASAFSRWQALLDPAIEVCAVQLPGRGARLAEPAYHSMPDLTRALLQAIDLNDCLPFAFFGHSLGGLLAFELARLCRRYSGVQPSRLFVSGCNAPRHLNPSRNLHKLPDAGLIEALRGYNGTPPELLEHRELMELVLPAVRADFALVEEYSYELQPLLQIPLTVLGGRSDDRTAAAQLGAWCEETAGECRLHWFEGDHFFIDSGRAQVLTFMNKQMRELIELQEH